MILLSCSVTMIDAKKNRLQSIGNFFDLKMLESQDLLSYLARVQFDASASLFHIISVLLIVVCFHLSTGS